MPTPAPATNLQAALRRPVAATGDYEGGAEPNMFTAAAHGLVDGSRLWLIYEAAAGVVTGGALAIYVVKRISDSTFQLANTAGEVIANTADGLAVFLNVSK